MEEKFRKYVDGNANPEEIDSVISNLLSDENTQELNKLLSSYWQECLNQKTIIPTKRDFIEKIHQRLGTTSPNFNRRYFIYKTVSYVAAIFLLVFVIGGIFYFQRQNNSNEIITQTITTPYGARTSFELPDGTKIWLNSGSKVVFPLSYGKERTIELVGEAFFNVKKNGKPFVVSTEQGDIEVLGTTFNVSAYDEEMFQTTLVTGKVKIDNNKEIFLEPGQQYYRENNQEGKVIKVNPEMFISWVNGELIFKNETFKNVVKRLERWYNVKINLQDDSIEELRFTGTIRMESFSEVLEILKITSSVQFTIDEETRIVTITKSR